MTRGDELASNRYERPEMAVPADEAEEDTHAIDPIGGIDDRVGAAPVPAPAGSATLLR